MKKLITMLSFKPYLLSICTVFITFSSCEIDSDYNEIEVSEVDEMKALNIPEGFDYKTHQEVKVIINDNQGYARYDVYAYSDEKLFAGTETFENEAGEMTTESIYKLYVLNKLFFYC